MGDTILLPGDKVRPVPETFPAVGSEAGTILDTRPSDLKGYDIEVQFPGWGPVLMYTAEVVPA